MFVVVFEGVHSCRRTISTYPRPLLLTLLVLDGAVGGRMRLTVTEVAEDCSAVT